MNYQIKPCKLLKRGVLLFLLASLVWSCENDEVLEDVNQEEHTFKTVSKSQAINVFQSFQKKKEEIISKSSKAKESFLEIRPNWHSFKEESLSFTDALLSSTDIETNTKNSLRSRLIFLNVDGRIIRVIESKQAVKQFGNKVVDGFVYFHNLDGKFITGYKLENSIVTKRLVKKGEVSKAGFLSMISLFTTECEADLVENVDFCYDILDEVVVNGTSGNINTEASPIYYFFSSGGGYEDYDPYGYSSDYDGGGGGSSGGSDNEGDDRIKNELNDPCARNIFTQLEIGSLEQSLTQTMNPETNTFFTFSKTILEMFRGSDVIHLTIQNGNTGGSNAYTNGAAITIGNDYLDDATQLSIARTMIHETVHAYINAMYSQAIEFNSFSFQEKLNKYAEDNGYTIGTNEFHHEFMSQYVDAMAISLLQWDTDYGTGGNLGWDYYQSMAYAGLSKIKRDSNGNPILDSNNNPIRIDTDSFKKLVPNEKVRNNIKKIIENEAESNRNSKGTECN